MKTKVIKLDTSHLLMLSYHKIKLGTICLKNVLFYFILFPFEKKYKYRVNHVENLCKIYNFFNAFSH